MKKIFTYLIIILLFTGIFGLSLQSVNIKEEAPVIGSALDFISPAVAYADSDTFETPYDPPPPPIDGG